MKPLPSDRGPFYLAVSATLNWEGEVSYRILRQNGHGDRLTTELAGLAYPTCPHLECRLANLGAAAVDWAYLMQVGSALREFHPEQMGLNVGPE